MLKIKVKNMVSHNGNYVPNQFIIKTDKGEFFQSYETVIAFISDEGIILDNNALNYSQTTNKYLYLFLNRDRKEIEKAIKEGKIKLKNLN